MAETHDRPLKKRRFFVDNHSDEEKENNFGIPSKQTQQDHPQTTGQIAGVPAHPTFGKTPTNALDSEQLTAIVGENISASQLATLHATYGNDLEGCINAYFDGSWRPDGDAQSTAAPHPESTITSSPPSTDNAPRLSRQSSSAANGSARRLANSTLR